MKIKTRSEISQIAADMKAAGKTLVFTNGCFDVLHVGHVRYLAAARELGDAMIVGLNSDASVRNLKGPNRPINPENDRAEVLSALQAVDYVVIFDELTAENLIKEIKPDIYVKGGDYDGKELPEARIVASYGGRLVLIPEVQGKSTTNIICKMRQGNNFESI